jgi:heme exporter protein CcmD
MNQIAEYLHMGGYAMFVWPAYALVLVGLGGILWLSIQSWKAREAEFSGLKAARDGNSDSGASS